VLLCQSIVWKATRILYATIVFNWLVGFFGVTFRKYCLQRFESSGTTLFVLKDACMIPLQQSALPNNTLLYTGVRGIWQCRPPVYQMHWRQSWFTLFCIVECHTWNIQIPPIKYVSMYEDFLSLLFLGSVECAFSSRMEGTFFFFGATRIVSAFKVTNDCEGRNMRASKACNCFRPSQKESPNKHSCGHSPLGAGRQRKYCHHCRACFYLSVRVNVWRGMRTSVWRR
jgi:hypothetical protein